MARSSINSEDFIRRLSEISTSLKVPGRNGKNSSGTLPRRQTTDSSWSPPLMPIPLKNGSMTEPKVAHFTSQFFRQMELNTPVRFLPLITRIRARHERKWSALEERYGIGSLLFYLQKQTGISMLTWGMVLVAGVTITLDFLFLHYAPVFSYLVGLVYPLSRTREVLERQHQIQQIPKQSSNPSLYSPLATANSQNADATPMVQLKESLSFHSYDDNVVIKDGSAELKFWLRYWSIFATVQFLDDHFPKRLRLRVPLFPVLKTVFYIWLCHPGTKGANTIYSWFLTSSNIEAPIQDKSMPAKRDGNSTASSASMSTTNFFT